MTRLPVEERRKVRRAIKKCKELKAMIKPLEKEYSELHDYVKEKVIEQKKDFEFPEGGTTTFPSYRESYDTKMLDELIDNGTIDADTAQIILKCKKTTEIITCRII